MHRQALARVRPRVYPLATAAMRNTSSGSCGCSTASCASPAAKSSSRVHVSLHAYKLSLTMRTTPGLSACHMVQQIMYNVTSAGPALAQRYFPCHGNVRGKGGWVAQPEERPGYNHLTMVLMAVWGSSGWGHASVHIESDSVRNKDHLH